jgi:single-strand DNA-binding protein
MLNEPTITLHGNVVAAPELRFFDSGTPVAEFTVAQNPRFRRGDEWVDGEPVFLTVKVWREQAENVAESLLRGHRVTVTGRLRRRAWQDKETGEKRTRDEIEADDVAVRASSASACVYRRSPANAGPTRPASLSPAEFSFVTGRVTGRHWRPVTFFIPPDQAKPARQNRLSPVSPVRGKNIACRAPRARSHRTSQNARYCS